jgi:large conductance mechanosensitive channel
MITGFKEFIMRGNVIDLAVAFVIGVAFTALVTAVVEGIFNPLIAAVFQAESIAGSLTVDLPSGGVLTFGAVLAAVITFILTAAVVYFVFVVPINRLKETQDRRRNAGVPAEVVVDPTTELDLLTEIRDLLAQQPQGPKR